MARTYTATPAAATDFTGCGRYTRALPVNDRDRERLCLLRGGSETGSVIAYGQHPTGSLMTTEPNLLGVVDGRKLVSHRGYRNEPLSRSESSRYIALVNLDAVAFSKQWVQAWNAHDVEAVLAYFHDDVVFTSPVAAKVLPETAGVVRGKPALRYYWTRALQRIRNLRFVVDAVYEGIDTVVIVYRNQDDGLVSEVLRFSGDLVTEGHGTYIVAA